MNLVHQIGNDTAVADLRDAVDLSFEIGSCKDVIQMERFVDVKDHRSWTALGTGPERLTG